MKDFRPRQKQKGFTLIEMIGVLAMIAILAGIVAPKIFDAIADARKRRAEGDMHAIQLALISFAKDTGMWPGRRENATDLIGPGAAGSPACGNGAPIADYLVKNAHHYPNWRGPYLNKLPEDPWGHRYEIHVGPLYGTAGGNAWILSVGPNGRCETKAGDDRPGGDDAGLLLSRTAMSASGTTASSSANGASGSSAGTRTGGGSVGKPTSNSGRGVNLTTVSGADILKLTPEQIAKLSPEQIAMMSAADFAKLSDAQKAALTKAQLAERKIADGIRKLTFDKFGTVPAKYFKYLTPKQISTIYSDWWLNKIPTATLQAMTKQQVQALTGGGLRNGGLGKLSPEQRAWLTPKQLASLDFSNFPYLSPDQIASVPPKQISTIYSDWWLNKIPAKTLHAMTKEQVQALTGGALRNGDLGKLSPEQRAWLTPKQLASLDFSNFPYLSPDQIASVPPKQISTIYSDWWLNKIPTATLQAMTKAQLQALPRGLCAKARPRLTETQRSWCP